MCLSSDPHYWKNLLHTFDQTRSISTASSMQEAVNQAREAANEKDDAVVLSPAAPSFDMFKNYKKR